MLALSRLSALLYVPWLAVVYMFTGLSSVRIPSCGWDGVFFPNLTILGGALLGLVAAGPSLFGAALGLAAIRKGVGKLAAITALMHLILASALVMAGPLIASSHMNPFAT
jgi:hypothetical protein